MITNYRVQINKTASLICITALFIIAACTSAPPANSVKHPEWSRNCNIYEVNIRQYTDEGTFNAFATDENFSRLKDLGIDILWLMPIHPIGELNRKGSLGSYYSVKDYKGINPEFGTESDLKRLVEKAHTHGMYVIIDWVANHTSWDHPWTLSNPEFYTTDENGSFIPPAADWSDVIDLNFDNMQLWDEMIDALKYWVREFDIDGYRCDVAAMVPTEFWNLARKELDGIKPVFMLAEAHESELHDHAFDMTYGWQYKDLFNKIATGEQNANDLFDEIKKEQLEYHPDAYRMLFITNHDENSWNGTAQERLGNALECFTVLSTVIPGMPLIYSGQEAASDKALSFFEKDLIQWQADPIEAVISKHLALKHNNKALLNGSAGGKLKRLDTDHNIEIFAFKRERDGHLLLAVFNLSETVAEFKIQSNLRWTKDLVLFSGTDILAQKGDGFELAPWTYSVYVNK